MPRAYSSAIAVLIMLSGCTTASVLQRASSTVHSQFVIVDAHRSEPLSLDHMARVAAGYDVIFFGERHGDQVIHELQLELLRELARQGVSVVLGMEMFERDVQPVLDAYLDGEIAEQEFLAEARPWRSYETDYRPLVEFAREQGWRVVATNLPRRIAQALAAAGAATLDTLPRAERAHMATDLLCPQDGYYDRFAERMLEHSLPESPAGTVEDTIWNFYLGQCARDETMAESITMALNPGETVVHVNGAFHSDYRLGIVPRLERRSPEASIFVISAVPVDNPLELDPHEVDARADHLVFTRRDGN